MIKKYFSIILASFFLLSVHNKGLAMKSSNIHPASFPDKTKIEKLTSQHFALESKSKEQASQHSALKNATRNVLLANFLANNIPIERAKEKKIVKTFATAANVNLSIRFRDPAGVSNIESSIASLAVVGTGRHILDKTPAKVITEKFNDLFSGSSFKIIAGKCLKYSMQVTCTVKLLELWKKWH